MDTNGSTPALDQRAPPAASRDASTGARLLVLLLAFAWGFNWIGTAIALREMSPWSLRFAGVGLGALVLFTAALLTGQDLRVPRSERIHVAVAGFLNVTAFQLCSVFAQMTGATNRTIIIAYSMPIWTTVLSRIVLGEKLTPIRQVAFALCAAGLVILLWPLFANGVPLFVFFALGCALSWGGATVYLKWANVKVAPLTNAAWQLLLGWAFVAAVAIVVEGMPHLWPLRVETTGALLYVGVFGVGLAHFLWWSIVGKLPAVTASIGSLLVPIVGVIGSAVILGERPTIPDMIGFVSIFAAAACVLLQPAVRHDEMPE